MLLNETLSFCGWVKRRFSLKGRKQIQKYETPQEAQNINNIFQIKLKRPPWS
jgi:hypothetical protein